MEADADDGEGFGDAAPPQQWRGRGGDADDDPRDDPQSVSSDSRGRALATHLMQATARIDSSSQLKLRVRVIAEMMA